MVKPKGFYMDGYLKENLDRAKELFDKDWDIIFLYDGYEGSGKSVKAMQDCKYIDDSFTMDRICFDPKQFTEAIKKGKPGQAVLYDEAYTGLSSRATMSLINRTLVSMLAEIRQKRLFVAIVMPTFFDLDKYVALWRSRALIHVYLGKGFQRGFFSFFNMDKKKFLYVNGKKFYAYSRGTPNFRGRFYEQYVVDEQEYRKLKAKSLQDREVQTETEERQKRMDDEVFDRLRLMKGITNEVKAEILGIAEGTYYRKLKESRQIGSNHLENGGFSPSPPQLY